MFKAYKRFRNQKIKDVRRELGRAHIIIALLSFVSIVLLIQETALLADINKTISAIAIVLLIAVAVTSLVMAMTLSSINKK